MLFNSHAFLFLFLPASWATTTALGRSMGPRAATASLIVWSLLFYGWWNAAYLLLLVPLMLANYGLAVALVAGRRTTGAADRLVLTAGFVLNLGTLGYFKYTNFLVDTVNRAAHTGWHVSAIVLPLGISFFIFQKIAFLVDAAEGRLGDRLDLLDYSLFVSFFPQLIAGPIVHHSEVMPQFRRLGQPPRPPAAMAVTIFAIGLAKKVLLADAAAPIATAAFTSAATGTVDLAHAWLGTLAYTVQLYFDFSGYTDMAIGAALLFGVHLPVNFASPYKATSLIDFWRRWHITLSRFLRDYLYIPLGGNRRGEARRLVNLFITMVLGGLWHGAGWTFVLWGALHGAGLVVNHAWRGLTGEHRQTSRSMALLGRGVTFVFVALAWIPFRATSLPAALAMVRALVPASGLDTFRAVDPTAGSIVLALLALAWFAPNTQELTGYEGPSGRYAQNPQTARTSWLRWTPAPVWAVATGLLVAACVLSLTRVSEFLYFQF